MQYRSLFDECFDVAIYGNGYAAWGALLALRNQGKRVLLFGSDADLLWESGRALTTVAGDCDHPQWQQFIAQLQQRNLYREGRIDCAGAEIVASSWLEDKTIAQGVLYGARAIGLEVKSGGVRRVTVATKSGKRELQATHWIDASETGELLGMLPDVSGLAWRSPDYYEQRGILEIAEDELLEAQAGGDSAIEPGLWQGSAAVCIRRRHALCLHELAEEVCHRRDQLAGAWSQASVAIFSVDPLPVYSPVKQEGREEFVGVSSVYSATPCTASQAVTTLAERFELGVRAVAQSMLARPLQEAKDGCYRMPTETRECDILIAGAGTSGAVAALACLRTKADFLLVDGAPFAGGVGTGGMINGYFQGQEGGLFEWCDQQADLVRQRLEPDPIVRTGWHAESKKIVFERMLLEHQRPLLGRSVVYDVEVKDEKISKVFIARCGKIIEVSPKAVIDASGDGDVLAHAGVPWVMGREIDGFPLSYSQPCLRVVKVDGKKIVRGANYDAGWVDTTDPEDFTRAKLRGVSQYLRDRYTDSFRLIMLAPVLGVRQSRHMATLDTLSLDDLIRGRTSSDAIGKMRSCLDTHMVDFQYEDDETMFWMWGCKSFRVELAADIPYRVLVPEGVRNAWIACRAAGMSPSAAYAFRMQRDMQRIGEAAGYAAAEAVRRNLDAAACGPQYWIEHMQTTVGAPPEGEPGGMHGQKLTDEEILQAFDRAVAGRFLWDVYKNRSRFYAEVKARLASSNADISWLAAVVMAMWEEPAAQTRLIAAIEQKEQGIPGTELSLGAFKQWIDIPNWLLAIVLLRRCGSGDCLEVLRSVAAEPDNLLDVRSMIALTIEKIVGELTEVERDKAEEVLALLQLDPLPETNFPPSRSIARALSGEPQQVLGNDIGSDVSEDHGWRLDFCLSRAMLAIGRLKTETVQAPYTDSRALVRRAFVQAGLA